MLAMPARRVDAFPVPMRQFRSVFVGWRWAIDPNTLLVWSKLIFAGFMLRPFLEKVSKKVRAFDAQNCDWSTRSLLR